MNKLRLVAGLVCLGFALRCGGDDPGGGGGSGTGGTNPDGSAGTGGSSGDGGTEDTTAPTFDGAESATAVGETQIALSWQPASDDVTPEAKIAYRVYVATTAGGQDFSDPWMTAPAGATGAVVSGLDAATHYSFVVRAVDEAGNEDTNTVGVDQTTSDTTPPVFNGVKTVTGENASSIKVTWNAASDNGSPASAISYRVYVSAVQGGEDFTTPTVTSAPGASEAIVTGLNEASVYFVVVRAVDGSGNPDTNANEASGSTLDGTPPVFGGATGATVSGTAINLSWDEGTDNVDTPTNLVYNVYQATSPGGQTFATPSYTSGLGETTLTVLNLNVSTTYYFVVRAQDSAGNEDTNSVEVSATTAASPDVTPPVFAGVDSVIATSASTIDLSWLPATDDYSQPTDIVYDVFLATTPGGQAFATPTVTTAAGATGHTITGLEPQTPYYVVVRARDQAGNSDSNTVQQSATTFPDTIAPTFAGLVSVTPNGPTSLLLAWVDATDDITQSADIVYRVYRGTSPGGVNLTTPILTTTPGATSAVATNLAPNTNYYFIVRAVDEANNQDSNTVEKTGKTDPDTTAPTFGGAQSATPQGPTSVLVGYNPASDDVTPTPLIVYDLWLATTPAGLNLTGPPNFTSAAGATTILATGLVPNTNYSFVVRARDQAGNRDSNTNIVSTTTPPDTTPPVFAGAAAVTNATNTSLTVTWAAATDNVTPQAQIQYQVCWSQSATQCATSFTAMASVTGATAYIANGLSPSKTYYFVVRARDQANNVDSNTVVRSGSTTADVTPPVFGGITGATGQSATTVQLTWSAASDNVDAASSIVYDVYYSTTPGGQNFLVPDATSTAGATSIVVSGLLPNTTYYFVVRARDTAGNRDSNTVQISEATLPDTTPPTFAGATVVNNQTETTLRVNWNPATDNTTAQSAIVYLVCWSQTSTACQTTFVTMATTAPGAVNYTATNLTPNKAYYFVVRARDAFNNVDTNTVVASGTTLADTAAPTFAGATSVSNASSTSLTVNWNAASDNVTPPANIIYRICRTTTANGCNGAGFTVTTSVTGVTSHQFNSLTPLTTYYFVVRAEDAAGNIDNNSVQVSGATVNDTTPPTFAGLVTATSAGATTINLAWTAASDNVSTPAQIVYDVYRATSPGGQNFVTPPQYTTSAGATSFPATGLNPTTTYYFVVRARDQAGNRDSNVVEKSAATTADVTAPVFAGVTSVDTPTATSLTAHWNPATDNVTLQANLVYDVCWSASSGGCQNASFVAMATSAAGGTQFTANGLSPTTTYYFVVRARDQAGNRDTNNVQVSGLTLADTTPPVFAGATSVSNAGVTSLRVNWAAATDNSTPQGNIVYDVCWNTASGACQNAGFSTMATTLGGSLFHDVGGLLPNTTYYFVVRARDIAGNQDTNSVQRSGATLADTTPPVFAGATSVSGAQVQQLTVNWAAATDNSTPQANINYLVCWSTVSTSCSTSFVTMATVVGGTSYNATNLNPNTTYYFVVRARDAFLNTDTNTVVRSGATLADTTPPVFAGATTVTGATITQLTVNWNAATDNVTPQGNINYLVCRSTLPTGCTTSFVATATVVGTTSYTSTNLVEGTTYYFVVRARDAALNVDTNTVVRNGSTLNDLTAPTWTSGPNVTASTTTPGRLTATWSDATDNYWTATNIRYRLCWNTISSNCSGGNFTSMAITGYNVNSYNINNLANNVTYYVYVRAEDGSGNIETGNHLDSAKTLVSYSEQIWPQIFNNASCAGGGCAGCHSWTRANTLNVSSGYNAGALCGNTLYYIEAGNPAQSYLYRKMDTAGKTTSPFSFTCANNYAGAQMPNGCAPSTHLATMRQWILDGAPNN
jgi:hypothetical protein